MGNIVYIVAPRDWFDYLATGATLLLSAIAVIIAVSTARQQNKIALFKERHETYQIIYYFIHAWEASLMFAFKEPSSHEDYIDLNRGFISFFIKFTSNTSLEQNGIKSSDANENSAYSLYMNIKCHLNRLREMFRLSASHQNYIEKLEAGYTAISAIESLKRKGLLDSSDLLKPTISSFFQLLKESDTFLEMLEKQVNVAKI